MAGCHPALGIHYKVIIREELICHINGSHEIASAIILEVENEVGHTLSLQALHAFAKLLVGGGTEIANTNISYARSDHITCIHRLYRYLVSGHNEM